jgi:hypothetical protein
MEDNSWLSEKAKTWIVTITMSILIGGALYGFYAAQVWKADIEERERIEMIQEQKKLVDRLKDTSE